MSVVYMKNKFLGFGDFSVGLSPDGFKRFSQAESLNVSYTGAESNVCTSLAMLGIDTKFVTRLPNNDIAHCAVMSLKRFSIDVSCIAYGGDRMGVIYTERGASQRPSKVVYDRKETAFMRAEISDFDWDAIFCDVSWLHFTGITAALSDNTAELCAHACREAKNRGIKVSCDLNYRKKLWTEEKAQSVMTKLMQYVDLVIGNEEDAQKVLGITQANTDVVKGELDRQEYINTAREVQRRFGIKQVAFTLRKSLSASDNEWSAMYYYDGEAFFSKTYHIHIVDRVGGGDAFSAGLIYALMNGYEPQRIVEFAVAASCLKHSMELDVNLSTLDEILALVAGDGSGRVQR